MWHRSTRPPAVAIAMKDADGILRPAHIPSRLALAIVRALRGEKARTPAAGDSLCWIEPVSQTTGPMTLGNMRSLGRAISTSPVKRGGSSRSVRRGPDGMPFSLVRTILTPQASPIIYPIWEWSRLDGCRRSGTGIGGTMRLARRQLLQLAAAANAAEASPFRQNADFARRRFLHIAAGAAAASLFSRHAAGAPDYPARPLRWIVGFAPGGATSTVSRIMAQWLSERLGQSVVVENKPGASTNLSIQATLSFPSDGYTVVLLTASQATSVTLLEKLPFNLLRDIAPVSALVDFPLVLVTNPSMPARTLPEFIAYAKDNPGKVGVASYGTGSTSHLALELFKTMTGLQLMHVPYRGEAPALTDTISGHVQGMFVTMTGALPHVQLGAVRLLAVAGKNRSEFAPDAPAIGETLPGYEASSWTGLGVARGTPPDIIARINHEINAGLADPAIRERLAAVAAMPIIRTPESFGAFMAGEVHKWGKIIRTAGIKPE
jgi:tripartite-type tricarboxylate transporter receptor subunit TctC